MNEIWSLINEMSPYLLLGFGFAGLLHSFVPASVYRHYLAGNDFRSVLWATLLGIPLPLCSCGVIPTAMSLRKEGASKGATTAFLIATPQTGIDSILATASLLGVPFAVTRVLAALLTGLMGGQIVNLSEKTETTENCKQNYQKQNKTTETPRLSFTQKLIDALKYGYVDMVQDIGRWLVLGLIIAGLITVFVPDDFFLRYAGTPLLSMLVVLLISIPMYVCATGSIPIAAALMLKGITPGAALVMLMAGPASNMASILVIRKVLGRKTLWLYLISITLGAIGAGLIIDYCLPAEWFLSHIVQTKTCCHHSPALFNVICSITLLCLLLYALITRFLPNKTPHSDANPHSDEGQNLTPHSDEGQNLTPHSDEGQNLTPHKIMEKRVFKVEGMMCNHCRANVEKALQNLQGAQNVTVDLASGTATLEGSVTDEAVIAAINSIGYTAHIA